MCREYRPATVKFKAVAIISEHCFAPNPRDVKWAFYRWPDANLIGVLSGPEFDKGVYKDFFGIRNACDYRVGVPLLNTYV